MEANSSQDLTKNEIQLMKSRPPINTDDIKEGRQLKTYQHPKNPHLIVHAVEYGLHTKDQNALEEKKNDINHLIGKGHPLLIRQQIENESYYYRPQQDYLTAAQTKKRLKSGHQMTHYVTGVKLRDDGEIGDGSYYQKKFLDRHGFESEIPPYRRGGMLRGNIIGGEREVYHHPYQISTKKARENETKKAGFMALYKRTGLPAELIREVGDFL